MSLPPTRHLRIRRFVPTRRRTWYWPVALAAMVAIVAIWTLTERQNRLERSQAIESAVQTNQSRVRSFEEYVLRTVSAADLIAWNAVHLAGTSKSGECPTAAPRDDALRSPIATSVLLLSRERICVLAGSASFNEAVAADLREQARRSARDLIIAPPVPTAGLRHLVPVIRVFGKAERRLAIVLVDPRRFTDFARDIYFSEADTISLIGLDAVVRARRVGGESSAGEKVHGLVMNRQFADPNGTYLGPSVLDGLQRYFSHRRLPDVDLFVTSGVPVADIEHGSADRLRANYIIASSASAAVILTSAFLMGGVRRRQRQIDELREANARLNEAQMIGSIGDWDYFPDQDLLVWSDNMRRLLGRGDDEVHSTLADVGRYLSRPDLLRVEKEIRQVHSTGNEAAWEVNVEVGGDVRLLRVIAVPIYDQSGRVVGVHGTTQDITKEAELRSLQSKLAELARLDSMNALTATLAHELNQPLAAASNYLAAAARTSAAGNHDGEKLRGYLASARDQLVELGQIISAARSLVSFSRAPSEPVNLELLITETILLLQTLPQAVNCTFEVQVDAEIERVRANAAQLKQVIFNIAKNGIEAVSNDQRAVMILRAAPFESSMIKIDVKDNGAGLAELQDPFAALSTTKLHGLGLGLSLARTIVEAHGGRIWIAETGEHGTTVSFTIPTAKLMSPSRERL